MQRVFNLFNRRKLSTQRIDDMASNAARIALEERVNRMLAAHALQPAPAPAAVELANPIQIAANS